MVLSTLYHTGLDTHNQLIFKEQLGLIPTYALNVLVYSSEFKPKVLFIYQFYQIYGDPLFVVISKVFLTTTLGDVRIFDLG